MVRRFDHYESVKNYAAAKRYLEGEVQKRPHDGQAYFFLVKACLEERDYQGLHKAFQDSQQFSNKRYQSQIDTLIQQYYREDLRAGVKALERQHFKKASKRLKYATEIIPGEAAPYRLLGYAYAQQGEYAKAESAYRRALALKSTDWETRNDLAELAIRRGNYEDAIEHLEAVPPDRRSSEALKRFAYAYSALGDHDKAKEFLRPGTRDYAVMLFNQGKYEKALTPLKKLGTSQPNDPEILRVLAETYLTLGDFANVIVAYRQVLDRFPRDRDALTSLVLAHEKLGQKEEAAAYRERLNRLKDKRK